MKSYNYGPLKVTVDDIVLSVTGKVERGRRIWKVKNKFTVAITLNDYYMQVVRVPSGFETDLGSIPRILQLFLGNQSTYPMSFITHDILCVEKVPQFVANSLIRIMMEIEGVPLWRRLLFFWGLQLFGYGSIPMKAWTSFVKIFKR